MLSENELKVYVGNRIREERKKKKLSQKELGEKIGVKHNTISSYENATTSPDQDLLFKISMVLEIKVDDLFPPIDNPREKDNFVRAIQMAKNFNLEDMNLLKELIEKALSLDEKERENFFDKIKFAIAFYDNSENK